MAKLRHTLVTLKKTSAKVSRSRSKLVRFGQSSANVGPCLRCLSPPIVADCCPMFIKFGQHRVNNGRSSARLGRPRPKSAGVGQISAESEPSLANTCQVQPRSTKASSFLSKSTDFGQIWADLGCLGSNSGDDGQNCAQCWPILAEKRPMLLEITRKMVKIKQTWAPRWSFFANFGRLWPEVHTIRSTSSQSWPTFAKIWQNSAMQALAKVKQQLVMGRFGRV